MRHRIFTAIAISVVCLLPLQAPAQTPVTETPQSITLHKVAPNFSFVDLQGKSHEFSAWRKQLPLFIFVDAQCPSVQAYTERVRALNQKYKERGLQVVYVFAFPKEEKAKIEKYVANQKISWLAVFDTDQKLTKLFDAQVTTDSYLFDGSGNLRYHGRIDDNIFKPDAVKERDLENAIEAVLANMPVRKPETKARGCVLPR